MEEKKIEEYLDSYQILGIKQTSDEKEIRKAYKNMAKILHPDRNKEVDSHAKFHKLQKAYEILTNESTKKALDELINVKKRNQERHNTMDAKRKLAKEKLLENEMKAKKKRSEEEFKANYNLKKEIEKMKEEAIKNKKRTSDKSYSGSEGSSMRQDGKELEGYMVQIKWSKKSAKRRGKQYDKEFIREFFSKLGKINKMYGEIPSLFVVFDQISSAQNSCDYHLKYLKEDYPKVRVYFHYDQGVSSSSINNNPKKNVSSSSSPLSQNQFAPLQPHEYIRNRFQSHQLFENSVLQKLMDF